MRAFVVRLPSGVRYWTVLDDELRPHSQADAFLQFVRLGRDGAESTTQAYATSIALFLTWCAETGVDWPDGARRLGWFITWLTNVPSVRPEGPVRTRGPRRVNAVLAAAREFAKHAVSVGAAPSDLLAALYEQNDDRWLPHELRHESGTVASRRGRGIGFRRRRARHRPRQMRMCSPCWTRAGPPATGSSCWR